MKEMKKKLRVKSKRDVSITRNVQVAEDEDEKKQKIDRHQSCSGGGGVKVNGADKIFVDF